MKLVITLVTMLCLVGYAAAQTPAFPSAEGGGRYASGGRAGKVYTVRTLADSGPGSLREALEAQGPRTVLFAVDGTIVLRSKIVVRNGDLTIAGHSAPGDGICIKDYPLYLAADNIIVRYIRCRMGDVSGMEDDAFGGRKCRNVIIDHCSCSWSVDECASFYQNEDFTMQWCIVSHSLSRSSHKKGAHGFGGIWGGGNATFHHNLLAHHSSRNPRFGSDGYSPVDYRNNVVYNWGFKSAYGGGRNGRINYVANYYKPGPATIASKRRCLLDCSADSTSRFFLERNVLEGADDVTRDNWLGVEENLLPTSRSDQPFACAPITEQSPEEAYELVLRDAGCSFRRDAYDRRVVEDVRLGRGDCGASFGGGNKGIIDSQTEVGGWPALRSGKAPKDSDGDGMPDKWERRHGLDPADASDGGTFTLDGQYTNLEIWLESLLK